MCPHVAAVVHERVSFGPEANADSSEEVLEPRHSFSGIFPPLEHALVAHPLHRELNAGLGRAS